MYGHYYHSFNCGLRSIEPKGRKERSRASSCMTDLPLKVYGLYISVETAGKLGSWKGKLTLRLPVEDKTYT